MQRNVFLPRGFEGGFCTNRHEICLVGGDEARSFAFDVDAHLTVRGPSDRQFVPHVHGHADGVEAGAHVGTGGGDTDGDGATLERMVALDGFGDRRQGPGGDGGR